MTDDTAATPTPRGPRSERGRLALAALGGGLAVVLIGAGAVAVSGVASADNSATPTPSTSGAPDSSERGPGRGPDPMGGMLGGLGGFGLLGHLGDALHGSAVVKDDDGSFVTYEAQRGEVTAVSASAISVKSDDGYEHTYVVDEDTVVNRDGSIEDIKAGGEVLVVATVDGGTSTATRIVDLTELRQRLADLKERFEERADGTPPRLGPWHRGDENTAPGSGSGGTGPGGASSSPAPTPSESGTA